MPDNGQESRVLSMWVICESPSDFPGFFTLREHRVSVGQHTVAPVCGLYASLDEARGDVPHGLCYIGRNIRDDPVVVETWL